MNEPQIYLKFNILGKTTSWNDSTWTPRWDQLTLPQSTKNCKKNVIFFKNFMVFQGILCRSVTLYNWLKFLGRKCPRIP